MSKHLNPLEKEFLIRLFRSNQTVKINDFCEKNNISVSAFKKWLNQYEEGGLEGLSRADAEIGDVLPEGIDRTEGNQEPTVIHTDQGSVYASKAYNDLIQDTNIVRSMSRAGKSTDNPVNESLNGWIKEELYMDFKIDQCKSRDEFKETMEKYVDFYNNRRPCYAIGYDTPVNYRKRLLTGTLKNASSEKM